MLEAEQQGSKKRRLPRGTSEYQAAWITDDIIEGDDDVSEEEEGNAANENDDVRYGTAPHAGPMFGNHNILIYLLYLPCPPAEWLVGHVRCPVAGCLSGL